MADTIAEALREADLRDIESGDFRRLVNCAIAEGLLAGLLRDAGYRPPLFLSAFQAIRGVIFG